MQHYISKVADGVRNVTDETLEHAANLIETAIQNGKTIFAFGNGGSEAIAEHLVHALNGMVPDKLKLQTHTNPKTSEMMDTQIDTLFDGAIHRMGQRGDLAILISASGNSLNINNVSAVCKTEGVTTLSLSGGGRIANDQQTSADNSIVFPINDQQILEDVTQIIIHLLAEIVSLRLQNPGAGLDIDELKKDYVAKVEEGFRKISPEYLGQITAAVIASFEMGRSMYLVAPDDGALSIDVNHTAHNLMWDALSNIDFNERPTNNVRSVLPTCHITGVGNDGGCGFVHALDISDNGIENDAVIVFARDTESTQTSAVLAAASGKGMKIYPICFGSANRWVDADLGQMVGHMAGRIVNSRLLLTHEKITRSEFQGQLLTVDLALLKRRKRTEKELGERYAPKAENAMRKRCVR
jgi:phosphoheptose isomerase